MIFDNLMPYPAPQKISIKPVDGDTRVPYERIKAYDDKEFELFIREWVVSLRNKYQVRGFGGAGDKGRDVLAKDEQGNYFSNFQLPETAIEQEINVYRACPTRKIEKASFLNTYEENGCQVPVGLKADDPQVYCLSTAFRLKDVERFVTIDSRFQPPLLLAKGHTTKHDGVSCETRTWKRCRGSHVDWWLYVDAMPWLAFEETNYEREKEQDNISKTD